MSYSICAKILVVDDDFNCASAIAVRLGAAGHSVLQASSADAALRILRERDDVDLLCTDIQMPGTIDGLRLAAVARERSLFMGIVVMSGRASIGQDELPCRAVFIPKAKGIAEIVAAIKTMISRDRRADLLSLLERDLAA